MDVTSVTSWPIFIRVSPRVSPPPHLCPPPRVRAYPFLLVTPLRFTPSRRVPFPPPVFHNLGNPRSLCFSTLGFTSLSRLNPCFLSYSTSLFQFAPPTSFHLAPYKFFCFKLQPPSTKAVDFFFSNASCSLIYLPSSFCQLDRIVRFLKGLESPSCPKNPPWLLSPSPGKPIATTPVFLRTLSQFSPPLFFLVHANPFSFSA